MLWLALGRRGGGLESVRVVLGLLGPLAEVASCAYLLGSVLGLAFSLLAATLVVLIPAHVVGITSTVLAADALMSVGFVVPLSHTYSQQPFTI